ncbi:MAG TPA: hypothetical protein VMH00_13920 [Candidatus Limnocylindrales bacterium]|nr:hypothetical protein [Candidatus Limnocylindrales bacterium]
MHHIVTLLSAALLFALPTIAQDKITVDDLSHHPFSTDFPSGGSLNLDIRSAEIHILGADDEKLSVRIGGAEGSEATDIQARFRRSGNSADLDVSGGPHNDIVITVLVPSHSNLTIRIPAGDVEVKGIAGNKDIRLRAGDLKIDVGDPADYAYVEASVSSGDIEARPFGEEHGGLFRSFHKSGSGKYTLVARLWAGDLTLR